MIYIDAYAESMSNNGRGFVMPAEIYIPLWVASTTYSSVTNNDYELNEGSTTDSGGTGTNYSLVTIDPNANPNQLYALECTMKSTASASYAATVALYNVQGIQNPINASAINTYASNFTVLRSSQFTMKPGMPYLFWYGSPASGQTTYVTDAYLVVFPM